jgi:hypothetical protein
MSEIEKEMERIQLEAENCALHSQVRELEKAVDFHTCSQSCTQDELHAAQARITALEAERQGLIAKWQNDRKDLMQHLPGYQYKNRVDDPEWEVAKPIILASQQRITQLEGALKLFVDTYRVMYNMDQVYPTSHEDQMRLEQELLRAFMQAQHAMTPEGEDA